MSLSSIKEFTVVA